MSHQDIVSEVSTRFNKALNSKDVVFFPSTIIKHVDLGVEFEIRLCPALQGKLQKSSTPVDAGLVAQGEGKKYDPFMPPYSTNLHVGDLQDANEHEYTVLLNKYSVVPGHFLLVTKDFQSQSSPLMPSDLLQIYMLLIAAKKAGKHILAFYNCGSNSGASQPHKHVQFIPVDDSGPPIEQLARSVTLETTDRPFSLTRMSYANHVFRFPAHLSSFPTDKLDSMLSTVFLSLLDLCISTIRHDPEYPAGKPSFNVLMTLEHMHLIPRRKDAHVLPEEEQTLSINALGFAGMLLVRSEEELEALKKASIGKVLRSVGLESIHDIQVAGISAEGDL